MTPERTPEEAEELSAAIRALDEIFRQHDKCEWGQVGPCVYCKSHGVRLYQGQLPDDRNPNKAICNRDGHDWDDANSMGQSGFYYLCQRCGEQEWTE